MTKIDISKVKAGDELVRNGETHKVYQFGPSAKTPYLSITVGNVIYGINEFDDYTAHKPAAAPEPVEWVTEEQVADAIHSVRTSTKKIAEHLNRELTSKYGPAPVIKTATGEEEGEDWVLVYYKPLDYLDTCRRCDLDPGDRYVEVPKCCGEGEA